MYRGILFAVFAAATLAPGPCAAQTRGFSRRFHGQDHSESVLRRRRLHSGRLIAGQGTVTLSISNQFTPEGDYTQSWNLQWTPDGGYLFWGRTEYSMNFDAVTSAVRPGLPRLTHTSDHIGVVATTILHDGDKLDIAIAPQATFLLRDDEGARIGGSLISRYDYSPGGNIIGALSWTGATTASPSNPPGIWDASFGVGRRISSNGRLSRLEVHGNVVFEKATATNRLNVVSEGVVFSVTGDVKLSTTGMQLYSTANSGLHHQILFSLDWNLGKPKDWFRKR